MAKKLEYEIRRVIANNIGGYDGNEYDWEYDQSFHMADVLVKEDANLERAFLRNLHKLGIVCKQGACVVIDTGDGVLELQERKTMRPLFELIPQY